MKTLEQSFNQFNMQGLLKPNENELSLGSVDDAIGEAFKNKASAHYHEKNHWWHRFCCESADTCWYEDGGNTEQLLAEGPPQFKLKDDIIPSEPNVLIKPNRKQDLF